MYIFYEKLNVKTYKMYLNAKFNRPRAQCFVNKELHVKGAYMNYYYFGYGSACFLIISKHYI